MTLKLEIILQLQTSSSQQREILILFGSWVVPLDYLVKMLVCMFHENRNFCQNHNCYSSLMVSYLFNWLCQLAAEVIDPSIFSSFLLDWVSDFLNVCLQNYAYRIHFAVICPLEIKFIYFCKLVKEGQLSGLGFNSINAMCQNLEIFLPKLVGYPYCDIFRAVSERQCVTINRNGYHPQTWQQEN